MLVQINTLMTPNSIKAVSFIVIAVHPEFTEFANFIVDKRIALNHSGQAKSIVLVRIDNYSAMIRDFDLFRE